MITHYGQVIVTDRDIIVREFVFEGTGQTASTSEAVRWAITRLEQVLEAEEAAK